MKAERDSLIAFIKKTEQNPKIKHLQAAETAINLVKNPSKMNNKENKRPSSGRRVQPRAPVPQENDDNIPAFLKATSGLKDSQSLDSSFLNITKIPSKPVHEGFLESISQAQEGVEASKQEDSKGLGGMRKSRTLGLPSAQSSMA